MKKGTFRIKVRTEKSWKWEEVNGFYTDVFGVHKTSNRCFTASHLRTGLRLASFDTLRQARELVKRMEEYKDWPVDWSNGSGAGMDYKPNAPIANDMVHNIRYYF